MKKTYVKIFSFILCLSALFSLLSLAICAETEKYTPIQWTMDENVEYIYGGEKRYDRYYVNYAFYGDGDSLFYFVDQVTFDGKSCQVYGESADPHIVSVKKGDGYSFVFADAEGKKLLDDLINKKDCIYYLEDFESSYYVEYSVLDEAFVSSLNQAYRNKGSAVKKIQVNELPEGRILEITVHDRTLTKAYQNGAVYIMPNGTYYYICFEDLDNSYFDADGYFSYRYGSVNALILQEAQKKAIDNALKNMEIKESEIIYESDVVAGYIDINGNWIMDDDEYYADDHIRNGTIAIFLISSIFFGLLIPAVLLVFSLILANSEKTKKAKCWYIVTATTALWMILAIVFCLLVVL